MALPRRASGGVFGSTAVSPTGHGAFKLRSIGDNRSTLPNALALRATMVEPLSPMALPRRASAGVFGSTAVSPTGHGAFKLRSIGDNRSTLPNALALEAPMVEPLSPMALPRRVSGGVFGSMAVSPTGHGAFKLRSIGDNRSTPKRSFFTYQNRDTNRTCCYIQSADEKPPSAVFDFSRMHTDMYGFPCFSAIPPQEPGACWQNSKRIAW
jgi:uncharacterized membrane protein